MSMDPQRCIVHVAFDEKFIDMAMREFEIAAPGRHRLVILGKRRPLKFVKTQNLEFCDFNALGQLARSDECRALVFHSLSDAAFLKNIPADKRVIWLGWGFDYYDRLLSGAFPGGLLMPATRTLMASKPGQPWLPAAVQKTKTQLKRWLGRSAVDSPDLLQRVDYFSPVIDVEHQLACQLNPWFQPKFVPWNYGTAEDDYGAGRTGDQPLGINILVGNSATSENNHIEVFEALERCPDLDGRQIIVPLSYGDEWYRDEVVRIGRKKFGDQLVPLTSFMSADEYMNILQGCGNVFMNHFRQQAFGNICIMMLKGARLHMNPVSPLYRWLDQRGAVIASIGHANEVDQQSLAALTDSERLKNVEVIMQHFGRDVQRQKTKGLVEIALQPITLAS